MNATRRTDEAVRDAIRFFEGGPSNGLEQTHAIQILIDRARETLPKPVVAYREVFVNFPRGDHDHVVIDEGRVKEGCEHIRVDDYIEQAHLVRETEVPELVQWAINRKASSIRCGCTIYVEQS